MAHRKRRKKLEFNEFIPLVTDALAQAGYKFGSAMASGKSFGYALRAESQPFYLNETLWLPDRGQVWQPGFASGGHSAVVRLYQKRNPHYYANPCSKPYLSFVYGVGYKCPSTFLPQDGVCIYTADRMISNQTQEAWAAFIQHGMTPQVTDLGIVFLGLTSSKLRRAEKTVYDGIIPGKRLTKAEKKTIEDEQYRIDSRRDPGSSVHIPQERLALRSDEIWKRIDLKKSEPLEDTIKKLAKFYTSLQHISC